MSAIDQGHDYAADVRAAYRRLLEVERAEKERLRTQLAAAIARVHRLQAELAECDGSAREDAEHDALSEVSP